MPHLHPDMEKPRSEVNRAGLLPSLGAVAHTREDTGGTDKIVLAVILLRKSNAG